MSARKTNQNARFAKQNAPKPYCKVCHDAGKTIEEYSSHFVKSEPGPNGKVVCPTLLSLECRYCYKNGHSAGYCPILADKEKEQKRVEQQQKRAEAVATAAAKAPTKAQAKVTNAFNALADDSSSEDDVPTKVTTTIKKSNNIKVSAKEEFPALCATPSKKVDFSKQPSLSYAGMVSQIESEERVEQLKAKTTAKLMPPIYNKQSAKVVPVTFDDACEYESEEEVQVAPVQPRILLKASELDWAMSDSEDEDW